MQYGNPSNHALATLGITLAIWLDYNSVYRMQPNSKLGCFYARLALLAACVGLSFWVGYTRVVLGVHGINQVWYGFMLGAWYAGTAHFIIKEPMLKLI